MPPEFRVLGPLEADVDGRPVELGGPKQRALLARLLLQPNTVVPAARLVDELWADEPPASAANLVQGYVSGLRKVLGRAALETRGAGYAVRVDPGALDLGRFEAQLHAGSRALEAGQAAEAADTLARALAEWRGPALADLADERVVAAAAGRLEELRVLALERRVEADLELGRAAMLVAELEQLVAEHPLRERPRALLMLALYRTGRQAEALDAYRAARETLVGELGLEPGAALADLQAAILRQDPELGAAGSESPPAPALRSVLVAALALPAVDTLLPLAEPLARDPARELLAFATVSDPASLAGASRLLHERLQELVARGLTVRAAAFTSVAPGVDLARLAREQDVDLLLVDAPDRLLEDARLLTLLEQATCDVGVVVGGPHRDGPVLVPFAGAEHDWAAVELGAWLARSRGVPLRLAGATAGGEGRDASRLLASASIAVQRALGVHAEPLLVEPEPEALVAAAAEAGVVAVGLTERWRREGLGRARTALATQGAAPAILVRRGVRPGGLAPRGSETRFTWTVAG